MKPGRKAFTLIEAAASMALLGMLAFMGATSLLKLAPKYDLERAVWEVRSLLNVVRYRALFEGESYRVRFSSAACPVEKADESGTTWTFAGRTVFEKVALESNNSPIFTPEGTVSGLATITISNAWGGVKLTLAITGRIKTARIG